MTQTLRNALIAIGLIVICAVLFKVNMTLSFLVMWIGFAAMAGKSAAMASLVTWALLIGCIIPVTLVSCKITKALGKRLTKPVRYMVYSVFAVAAMLVVMAGIDLSYHKATGIPGMIAKMFLIHGVAYASSLYAYMYWNFDLNNKADQNNEKEVI